MCGRCACLEKHKQCTQLTLLAPTWKPASALLLKCPMTPCVAAGSNMESTSVFGNNRSCNTANAPCKNSNMRCMFACYLKPATYSANETSMYVHVCPGGCRKLQCCENAIPVCVAVPAGYCELAVPVCNDSADGSRPGSGGEGLCHLLHGSCCQPAGRCPQAPPAPSSAGTFFFSLDCILSSLLFLLCFFLCCFSLGLHSLCHQMNSALQPCPRLSVSQASAPSAGLADCQYCLSVLVSWSAAAKRPSCEHCLHTVMVIRASTIVIVK